jgi:hypothetical protein
VATQILGPLYRHACLLMLLQDLSRRCFPR